MARIDLHNFFKFYDEKNPNHVKAVQWLEDNIDWAEIYRGKKSTPASPAASAGDVCPHCGKSLGK